MAEADFGGDYLNFDNTQDDDIVTITSKPDPNAELEYNGKKKRVTNMDVEVNGKKLVYTPANKAGKLMVKCWGKEMDSWVGKQFKIQHVEDKMFIKPMLVEVVKV